MRARKRWMQQLLPSLCGRPRVRRYRVTPAFREGVFGRQLLADVLHSLKQNSMD